MGTLSYGKKQRYEFDDRTLEHLRVVITARLRKRESFFLTWTPCDGRSSPVSLWITPSVPIAFLSSSRERVVLSRRWVEQLMRASYSEHGLVLMPEPAADQGSLSRGAEGSGRGQA